MTDPATMSQWNYTEEELQALVGKHLLVGAAHCKAGGDIISREQFHGIIERINFKEGIILKLNGSNEERAVPLDFSDFKMARPGEYRLTGTNELVEDPDYTIKISIYPEGHKG